MNAINPKKLKFSFTLTLALTSTLILTLALTWLLSLRPVRLKIGDYYFDQGKFDQAVNWYEKVLRKEKLGIDQNRGAHLNYEEDLSKLKSSLTKGRENIFIEISRILGLGEIKDLKSSLTDSKFFLKDINRLFSDKQREKLHKAKVDLACFNIINHIRNVHKEKLDDREFDYLVSTSYFFIGLIDEAENNFILADSNYEKAVNLSRELLNNINGRKKKILPNVADEYFNRSPSINKVYNAYVLLESDSPLIIKGVAPKPYNYIEYETCPLKIIFQKYSSTKLKIQGEVLGRDKTSCIVLRVVFWGNRRNEGSIGEKGERYSLKGNFDISFSFSVPDGTLSVTPRITFDSSCFSEGKTIFVKDLKWH